MIWVYLSDVVERVTGLWVPVFVRLDPEIRTYEWFDNSGQISLQRDPETHHPEVASKDAGRTYRNILIN